MISYRQKLILTTQSSLWLLVAFATLFIFRWALLQFGVYVSDFEGHLELKGLEFIISSDTWNWMQVLWIYLFPYIGLLFVYVAISKHRKYPSKYPTWLLLLHSWTYLLTLVLVFFNPLLEIIYREGLYHALNWLHINRTFQLIFGIVLWIYLIFRMFRIASLFSVYLFIPSTKLTTPKQITPQLIYLWYIPFLILSLFILLVSNFIFLRSGIYLLSGMLVLLLVNTWLIRRYNVIVK